MAQRPRIRTARAGLLGGAGSTPMQSQANAAMLQDAGQSIARGVSDLARANERIAQNSAIQYVARTAPLVEGQIDAALQQRSEALTPDNVDGFVAGYSEQVDEIIAEALESTPARGRDQMRTFLARQRQQYLSSAMQFEAKRAVEFRVEAFETGANADAARLLTNPDSYPDRRERQLGLIDQLDVPESQKIALRSGVEKSLAHSYIDGLLNVNATEFAREELNSGDFDERLGPDAKQSLLEAVAGREAQMQANQARDTRATVAAAERATRATRTSVLDGLAPETSTDRIREALDVAEQGGADPASTAPLRRELDMLDVVQQSAVALRRTGSMPGDKNADGNSVLVRLDATIQGIEHQRRTQGDSEMLQMQLEAATSIRSQLQDLVKTNPLIAGVQAGVIPDVEPIDFEQPDSWTRRLADVEKVGAYLGAPVSTFQPDEVAAIQQNLAARSPAEQAAYMQQMTAEMPPELAGAVARQFSDSDDPITAMVVSMAGEKAPKLNQLMREAYIGRSFVEADSYQVNQATLRDTFASTRVGQALAHSPVYYDAVLATAEAIYAARSGMAEVSKQNATIDSGELDLIAEEVAGGTFEFGDATTLLPGRNVTEPVAQQGLMQITTEDLVAYGRTRNSAGAFDNVAEQSSTFIRAPGDGTTAPQVFDADDLRDYGTLVAVGNGLYQVHMAGRPVRTGPEQREYVLDLGTYLKEKPPQPRPADEERAVADFIRSPFGIDG